MADAFVEHSVTGVIYFGRLSLSLHDCLSLKLIKKGEDYDKKYSLAWFFCSTICIFYE